MALLKGAVNVLESTRQGKRKNLFAIDQSMIKGKP